MPCDSTCHDMRAVPPLTSGEKEGGPIMGRQKLLLYAYAALAIAMMAVIFWFSAQMGTDSSSKAMPSPP